MSARPTIEDYCLEFEELDAQYSAYQAQVSSLKSRFMDRQQIAVFEVDVIQQEMSEIYEYLSNIEEFIDVDHSCDIRLLKQKEEEYRSRLKQETPIVDIRGKCNRFMREYAEYCRVRDVKEAYRLLPPNLGLARQVVEDLKLEITAKRKLKSEMILNKF